MARGTWYRIDNIGKFYSAQAGSSAQTVFRCAATLADDIDEEILQHAVDKAVEAFPIFNVCLRSGLFWHYLEQAAKPPVVTPENLPLCFGFQAGARSTLFRVTYYRTRLNLEVSHIVSDGRGTLSFFKALLYAYVQERYATGNIPSDYDGSDYQKSEDSFNKYYERDKAGSTHSPAAYRLSGWHDAADPTFMEYHLPTSRVLDLARSHNVSLTSLVITAAICAVRAEMPRRERKRTIRLNIPVDLRRFFESATIKNFFGLAYVSYVPGDADEPFGDIAAQVQMQLKTATSADALKSRMNRMISMEKNPFLRIAPLFVKNFVLAIANRLQVRKTTATISNLGALNIAPDVKPYVRDINIMTSTTGLSFVLCSLGEDLSIGISTIYANPNVVKNFCRFFSNEGIEGYFNSNRTNERRIVDLAERAVSKVATSR